MGEPERLIAGFFFAALGLASIVGNRWLGRAYRWMNAAFLPTSKATSWHLREDARGRVWPVIMVGAAFVALGVLLIGDSLR